MNIKFILENFVRAGYKLLYLYSIEEEKCINLINNISKDCDIEKIYYYDISQGLVCDNDKKLLYRKDEDNKNIYKVLDFIENCIKENSFVIFKDCHHLFDSYEVNIITRKIKNCLNKIKADKLPVTIFFISPYLKIPTEIEKESIVVDINLPTREEIENIIDEFIKVFDWISITNVLKSRIVEALSGLTEIEIKNIVSYCLQEAEFNEKSIDKIIEHKRQIIRKGGILELIKTDENINDIGGLNNLKDFINTKKYIFNNIQKAREFNVDIPKGILLFGMPGVGKSLTAKVVANLFDMPLLRLDMGSILGPYLGQSEENLRKSIKLAEAVAPSVLWIDEIEKSISTNSVSSTSDVTSRILASLLTWMQEKKEPVFVIATSNSLNGIPPEFLRKGRFDEIFFVDFPKEKEIKEILKLHIQKRKKDNWINNLNIDKISKELEEKEFSGAEIEAIVREVIEYAFVKEIDNVDTKIFLDKIKDFRTLSETMKDKIKELREKSKSYGFKQAGEDKK